MLIRFLYAFIHMSYRNYTCCQKVDFSHLTKPVLFHVSNYQQFESQNDAKCVLSQFLYLAGMRSRCGWFVPGCSMVSKQPNVEGPT